MDEWSKAAVSRFSFSWYVKLLSTLITPPAALMHKRARHQIHRIHPPGRQRTIITINLSDLHRFVYSEAHYSKNMCFQLCFRLRSVATLLMTPVPCNFLRVANSDYRVEVALQAEHHLLQLLFSTCSAFNTDPAAVCVSVAPQFPASQPTATDFHCTVCSDTPEKEGVDPW